MINKSFNQSQVKAIQHFNGPMMVLAGPGSGKTTVITQRIRFLINEKNVAPGNILVVTFTKAAAVEMKQRFRQLMDGKVLPVSFGTFHAIFFSILKHAYGFEAANIVDDERKMTMLRELVEKCHLDIDDEAEFIGNLAGEISKVKGDMIQPEHYYPTGCSADVFRKLYSDYEMMLKQYRILDFDDMLVYTWELFNARKDILEGWQRKFQYILIDEFQDVNRLQYEIVKMLTGKTQNLFIVGDDDQSIYHFRGARPEFMLDFDKDFPDTKKVILNTNYRSSASIVKISERCIRNNKIRFQKSMKAFSNESEEVIVKAFKSPTEESEAVVKEIMQLHEQEGIPYSQIAILFRTNFGSRSIVNQLMNYAIPFKLKDRLPNIFDHWIMKNILAYIRIAKGGTDRQDYLQIINRPNRYISRQCFVDKEVDFEKVKQYYDDKSWMVERLENFEEDLHMLDRMPPYAALNYLRRSMGYEDYLFEYAMERHLRPEDLIEIYDNIEESARGFKNYGAWFEYIENYTNQLRLRQAASKNDDYEGLVLSTMHSSKGLEYEAVFLLDVNEGVIPYQKAILDEEIEEERRMFYVAMTRAKKYLRICFVKERYGKEMEPSRFVSELLE